MDNTVSGLPAAYADYTGDLFDPAVHAARIITSSAAEASSGKPGSDISNILASLTVGIESINKRINEQVVLHYDSLLSQVTELNTVDSCLTSVRAQYETLSNCFQKIHSRLSVQFAQITESNNLVENAQKIHEALRQIDRFLSLVSKMESFIPNTTSTSSSAAEYQKAALVMHEIQCVLSESDLLVFAAIKPSLDSFKALSDSVIQFAFKSVSDGLQSHNQSLVSDGLQVYYNSHTLGERIKNDLYSSFVKKVSVAFKTAFDVQAINQQLKEIQQKQSASNSSLVQSSNTGVRRAPIDSDASAAVPANQTATSNIATWANLLWSRIESLADVLYTNIDQMYLLTKVLKRKRDPISLTSFMDEVLIAFGDSTDDTVSWFWNSISLQLEQDLKSATKCNLIMPFFYI